MTLKINKKTLIPFTTLIIILVGATIVFSKTHNTFEFKEHLNNVNTLNQYISSHRPLKLFDLNIEKKNLNKIVIEDSTIDKPRWCEIKIHNSKLINTQILNGTLENIDFSHSNLSNVTFEKIAFDNVLFDHSKLNNIKFIDCTFKTGSFYQITSSNINFEKTDMNDGDFRQAEVNLNMKDSKFNDIDFSYLKGLRFTMQNGELKNSTFDSAHLDEFKLDRVNTSNVDFSEGKAKNVFFKDSTIDINMPKTQINTIHIVKGKIIMFSPGDAPADQVIITDCDVSSDISFFGSKINQLNISNCKVDSLSFGEAKINTLKLKNIIIDKESLSPRAKISEAYLDNVKINGNIDLHNTIMENLYLRDFQSDLSAKVNTKNSNLEFTGQGLRLKGVWPEITPDRWLIFRG